jgi:hypothetical protein
MTAEREPTRDRIAQTKALLEAGFLAERVPDGDGLLAPAEVSIGAERPSETLTEGLVDAWRRFWEPE